MINYNPLWETMKKKNITKYYLITYANINNNTLHSLRHNKPVSLTTIERLCEILDCEIQEVVKIERTI